MHLTEFFRFERKTTPSMFDTLSLSLLSDLGRKCFSKRLQSSLLPHQSSCGSEMRTHSPLCSDPHDAVPQRRRPNRWCARRRPALKRAGLSAAVRDWADWAATHQGGGSHAANAEAIDAQDLSQNDGVHFSFCHHTISAIFPDLTFRKLHVSRALGARPHHDRSCNLPAFGYDGPRMVAKSRKVSEEPRGVTLDLRLRLRY